MPQQDSKTNLRLSTNILNVYLGGCRIDARRQRRKNFHRHLLRQFLSLWFRFSVRGPLQLLTVRLFSKYVLLHPFSFFELTRSRTNAELCTSLVVCVFIVVFVCNVCVCLCMCGVYVQCVCVVCNLLFTDSEC